MCCNLMREYVLKAEVGGKQRRLLILHPDPDTYNVYWDKVYLGKIQPIIDDELGLRWTTEDDVLMACAQEVGEYIEGCDELNK